MSQSSRRAVVSAVARGFLGKCPACGRGRLIQGYIRQSPHCSACQENLAPYQTADFAPYLVTFAVGLIFTPLVLVLSGSPAFHDWAVAATLAAAIATALVLLPRAKGAAIGLLWALDVRAP